MLALKDTFFTILLLAVASGVKGNTTTTVTLFDVTQTTLIASNMAQPTVNAIRWEYVGFPAGPSGKCCNWYHEGMYPNLSLPRKWDHYR
ncbi:hypothetical protein BYT27DRAFT_7190429, partial [Phlegmacium glaucopus]